MRTKVTNLLLRDFGSKPKIRTVENIAQTYKMSNEDAEKYLEIASKYGITTVLDEFPYWLISDLRKSIMNCMRDMSNHITIANSIYPNSIYECDLRRQHQDLAIGQCEYLLQELQYIMTVIPLNINKLMPYVEMVEKELALLKAWRKSDNATRTRIMEKEIERYSNAPHVIYPYLQYSNQYTMPMIQPMQIYPADIPAADNTKKAMCRIVDNSQPRKFRPYYNKPPYKSNSSY